VFTALAGTRLADITVALATHRQCLPFDPPLVDAGATIGGTVAAGLSGSGRYRYGGVRDFIIGARIVDGEGRLIRSGGKVVKNAAGFLLHHGMVGSLGRFGVLAEVTFKVFPAPEAHTTLRVHCDSLSVAVDTLRTVERARLDLAAIDFDHCGTLWIRVAGSAAALHARVDRLQRTVPWESAVLEGDADWAFWSDAREFGWAPPKAALVKIPAPPLENWTIPARFACGGSVAWAAVDDGIGFSKWLADRKLLGLVVRGPMAGALIGRVEPNIFEERVRSVLDPRRRFTRDWIRETDQSSAM
jgi:glycolate oxidase FAD binding subunit